VPWRSKRLALGRNQNLKAGTIMSEHIERPASEIMLPAPARTSAAPDSGTANAAGANQSHRGASADSEAPHAPYDPTSELKRNLEATRLPPDLLAQFLAELPPPEEMERLYREIQENGGLSFEQLFDPADLEAESKP
jgi:hypothetical protein